MKRRKGKRQRGPGEESANVTEAGAREGTHGSGRAAAPIQCTDRLPAGEQARPAAEISAEGP